MRVSRPQAEALSEPFLLLLPSWTAGKAARRELRFPSFVRAKDVSRAHPDSVEKIVNFRLHRVLYYPFQQLMEVLGPERMRIVSQSLMP